MATLTAKHAGRAGIPADRWLLERDGMPVGPLTGAELKHLATVGIVQPAALVLAPHKHQWVRAGEVPGLFPHTRPF